MHKTCKTSFHRLAPRLLALAALFGLGASLAQATEIELQGVAKPEGRLLVAVFAEDGWLRKPVALKAVEASTARDGRLSIALPDLPAGKLGLSVIHDLNGNGRLDMNAVGMPTEPYGFSNNAAGMFGPPRFEAAAFEAREGLRIAVTLN